MQDLEQRRQLVRVGDALYSRRLVVGAEGNISIRLDARRFLTTPSGLCKGWLAEADLVVVDLDGTPLEDTDRVPSSEWGLHREIYCRCPDAHAVCHGHPAHATACAAAHLPLDHRILTEAALLLGPVPLADPAVSGTDEVARSVRPHLPAAKGLLLANHGAVAWGAGLDEAFFNLEAIERLAEVTVLSRILGGAVPLTTEFLARSGQSRPPQDEASRP